MRRGPIALTVAVVFVFAAGGAAQPTWTEISRIYQHTCRASTSRWTVCGEFTITQSTPSPGGPQALEGYTYVNHPTGVVGLALGTVGNVEVGGTGEVLDVRALQGGVIISGPGDVEHATSLMLMAPKPAGDYHGQVNVKRADYLSFDNGWSLRPDGDRLLLCDPHDRCRDL